MTVPEPLVQWGAAGLLIVVVWFFTGVIDRRLAREDERHLRALAREDKRREDDRIWLTTELTNEVRQIVREECRE